MFPEIEMVAHAADLGMTFYRGAQFPQKYRGGIFSAQHGSWNRTVPIGARVMFTSLKPDGTAKRPRPSPKAGASRTAPIGRPVDVAELPDGSLLVSDDKNGALYRIAYKAPKRGSHPAKMVGDGENVLVAAAGDIHHHQMIARLLRRDVGDFRQRMRGFQRRDDAFEPGAELEGVQRLARRWRTDR